MIKTHNLEANIVRHCTNKCVACSHASAFTAKYFMRRDQLRSDLGKLQPIMHVERFYIVGGEPCLHPEIEEFIKDIKETGIADKVGIVTNGRLLSRMKEEFWSRLDLMLLSVYANLPTAMVRLAEQKRNQYGFTLEINRFTEFYKQFKITLDGSNFKTCAFNKGMCYTVHDGYFYLCPQSAFYTDNYMGLPQAIDGLSLDHPDLEAEIVRHMELKRKAYTACCICSGTMEKTPWREIHNFGEWVKQSTV